MSTRVGTRQLEQSIMIEIEVRRRISRMIDQRDGERGGMGHALALRRDEWHPRPPPSPAGFASAAHDEAPRHGLVAQLLRARAPEIDPRVHASALAGRAVHPQPHGVGPAAVGAARAVADVEHDPLDPWRGPAGAAADLHADAQQPAGRGAAQARRSARRCRPAAASPAARAAPLAEPGRAGAARPGRGSGS